MTIIDGINAALATVKDPELHHPLPDLGMVESVAESAGIVDLTIFANNFRAVQ
jgi:metal-sulfur cluster biosynthetic enzyme